MVTYRAIRSGAARRYEWPRAGPGGDRYVDADLRPRPVDKGYAIPCIHDEHMLDFGSRRDPNIAWIERPERSSRSGPAVSGVLGDQQSSERSAPAS